jgi:hypothetical protein
LFHINELCDYLGVDFPVFSACYYHCEGTIFVCNRFGFIGSCLDARVISRDLVLSGDHEFSLDFYNIMFVVNREIRWCVEDVPIDTLYSWFSGNYAIGVLARVISFLCRFGVLGFSTGEGGSFWLRDSAKGDEIRDRFFSRWVGSPKALAFSRFPNFGYNYEAQRLVMMIKSEIYNLGYVWVGMNKQHSLAYTTFFSQCLVGVVLQPVEDCVCGVCFSCLNECFVHDNYRDFGYGNPHYSLGVVNSCNYFLNMTLLEFFDYYCSLISESTPDQPCFQVLDNSDSND